MAPAASALRNEAARSDFYIRLGFNPVLTDFPLPAFEQCLDIAGLPRELPPAKMPRSYVLGMTGKMRGSLEPMARMTACSG